MDAVSLQPAGGAQAELIGILMIRAHLTQKGSPAKIRPDSRFGPRNQSGQRRFSWI